MSKKHKLTNITLSPQKYIRENARKLPVYECLINSNWKESKMCTVFIAREHKQGNITVGLYLVDLLCAGIKDTHYQQNITKSKYNDLISGNNLNDAFSKIDYTLAHNIIYAGHDFAVDLNIPQHKDFNKVTQFILDEDNDDIELIDIECGENGIPVIFIGEENFNEAQKLITHLENEVGPENFIVYDMFDDDDDDNFDYEHDDSFKKPIEWLNSLSFENYIYKQPLLERHEDIKLAKEHDIQLSKAEQSNDSFSDINMQEVTDCINRLYYNHFDTQNIATIKKNISNFIDFEEITDLPDDKTLGFTLHENDPLRDTFDEALNCLNNEDIKGIEKIIKKNPDNPFLKALQVEIYIINQKGKKAQKLLDKYIKETPDYLMFQVNHDFLNIRKPNIKRYYNLETINNGGSLKSIMNRNKVSVLEFNIIIKLLLTQLFENEDLLTIDSLIYELQTNYADRYWISNPTLILCQMGKMHFVKENYLKNERDIT
ncbi:MAG: hypothetical protein JW717_07915 [Marinilabiliaceae bacterium]|nr:hypothetical protein [Marinilabiliaceae bacterium]